MLDISVYLELLRLNYWIRFLKPLSKWKFLKKALMFLAKDKVTINFILYRDEGRGVYTNRFPKVLNFFFKKQTFRSHPVSDPSKSWKELDFFSICILRCWLACHVYLLLCFSLWYWSCIVSWGLKNISVFYRPYFWISLTKI